MKTSRPVRTLVLVLAVPAFAAAVLTGRFLLASDPELASLARVPAANAPGDDVLSGVWTVQGGAESQTFVGYRIREELGGFGVNTAVGRAHDVTGLLEIDGPSIIAVDITVDMRTLRSDDVRRDRVLREQALETDRFPTATFRLAEPIDVDLGAEATFATVASGDLTLHGVTNRVRIPIEARIESGQIVVVGRFEIVLDDYDIEEPSYYRLLSIGDVATVEIQLVFAGPPTAG